LAENSKSGNPESYKSNQTIANLDFDQLKVYFIDPIDNVRSHYNALIDNSQELNTPQYQESRISAFYRMIGFPVVPRKSGAYYSPGHDPNLNLNKDDYDANIKISNEIMADTDLVNQFKFRENVPINFSKIFQTGGSAAQIVTLGSLYIRDFAVQLSSTTTALLEDDPNKTQYIQDRMTEMFSAFGSKIYYANKKNLYSNHPLKPFIVCPVIDSSVRPMRNRICAPFLLDKSQTRIFQSQGGKPVALMRPYIEEVISVIYSGTDKTKNIGGYTASIIQQIKDNSSSFQDSSDIMAIISNPNQNLYNSQVSVFETYVQFIQKIMAQLKDSISFIQEIRNHINFKPIPDPNTGIESGTNGQNRLQSVDYSDTDNNKLLEVNYIATEQLKILFDTSSSLGIDGAPDLGDFAFSGINDIMYSVHKSVDKSFEDDLKKLDEKRNSFGNDAINHLKNIEIIMGEFSGLGLIDIVSIQAALWLMDPVKITGLIDQKAFARAQQRKDLNLKDITQALSSEALVEFEAKLNYVYALAQYYYEALWNGKTIYDGH
jgi:hypothetical protein